MNKEKIKESEVGLYVRIIQDWYKKCRTCRFWLGDLRECLSIALCNSELSDAYQQDVSISGYCPRWGVYLLEELDRSLLPSFLEKDSSISEENKELMILLQTKVF